MNTVYLNGAFVPADEAVVSVNDRGFLLADGVYEVTPAYRGRMYRFEQHRERLERGLAALRIDAGTTGLRALHERLLEANGLLAHDAAIVYLQITRGVAPRSHAFPAEPVPATVYAFAKAWQRPPREAWDRGFAAITVPDRRWSRVDIKSIALVPNVLAQQAARDAGVDDALFVRDGVALEGAHNNFFAVVDGELVTHPATNVILHGITRAVVLELAAELGIPARERPVHVEELAGASEAFFTGTTTEIRPCVRIDGRPVGHGRPGPVTTALFERFLVAVETPAEPTARDGEHPSAADD